MKTTTKGFLFLVAVLLIPVAIARGTINDLAGETTTTQSFATTTLGHVSIKSLNGIHTFDWEGILQPTQGGTGLSSISLGDLIYGSATNIFARLGMDSGATRYLSNTGASSTPAWTQINLSNGVTNTLPVQNGGTGITSFSKGDILVAQSSTTLARLPIGSDGQVLMASSTAPLGIAWVTLPKAPTAKHFQVDTGGALTTNLISYYKLEDTTDFWSTNNLTNNGSTPFNAGKVNNAADFGVSNTTKYLNSTINTGINGGSISLEAWVNITTAPAMNGRYTIITNGNAINQVDYYLFYQDTGGIKQLQFMRNKGGVAADTITVNTSLNAGTWYHVVGTYNGTTLTLYLNNVLQGTTAASGNGTSGIFNEIGVGIIPNGGTPSSFLSGLVDEAGIWSKALSTTEISDLYNGGVGQTITQ